MRSIARSSALIALVSLLAIGGLLTPRAEAQEVSAVASSALVIPDGNVTEAEASIASIGLRRGITEVQGVRFVHPVDVLSPAETTEDLQFGLEELEARANQLRDGDAADVAESTDALIDLFEQHLDAVRREQLVDVYMIKIGRAHV